MVDRFLNALSFLTILPIPFSESQKSDLAKAMIFFPVVGFLIAMIAWTLFHFSHSILPSRVSLLLLLIVPIFISGGLHIDGFADSCDGLFGGKDRLSILRIMKDSRIGTWGCLGVVLLVLIKWELLLVLPGKTIFFLSALIASRWVQVVLSFFLPYAGEGLGLGAQVAKKVGGFELEGATLFFLPVFFFHQRTWMILPGLFTFVFLLGWFYKYKLGGVTGDLLGAASELTEIFILFSAVILERVFS